MDPSSVDLSAYQPSWQKEGRSEIAVRPAHLAGPGEARDPIFTQVPYSEKKPAPPAPVEEEAPFPPDGWELVTIRVKRVVGASYVLEERTGIFEIVPP